METLTEFRDIEPEAAVTKWAVNEWTDIQLKHWLIIRNEVNGKQADRVIADLKKTRTT